MVSGTERVILTIFVAGAAFFLHLNQAYFYMYAVDNIPCCLTYMHLEQNNKVAEKTVNVGTKICDCLKAYLIYRQICSDSIFKYSVSYDFRT